MDTFVLSCPCLSIFVFGVYVVLQGMLSFLPCMLRVHMAGVVWTLLSGLCLSIFVLGLLCCPCLFLSSVLSFLPCMLNVIEFFSWMADFNHRPFVMCVGVF